MARRHTPMTGTDPVIVPIDQVPVPTVKRAVVQPTNPLLDSVRQLAETMEVDPATKERVGRSTGAGKISVPKEDLRRHLRWLWNAGDAMDPPVSVAQHNSPDPDDDSRVVVWYWTREKIRKSAPDDE